ncbi:glycosyltransferase family 2 protein [Bremerella cremea]|uniref:Glycosyltransferase 2-like domain-containing protein n=1 Tax=Blastopirellula marina TaxID=124 RepID=A0A2S8FZ04_9BACT|nr:MULTISPECIES: glycosyltransferase family 2 protein [Pirellulaceae]PQO37416.1 hypothetical protein C5Y83_05580 [Blastopirellula marina]RCS49803.1 glycosyltransferase family 2 protein [Bremerella cremea]
MSLHLPGEKCVQEPLISCIMPTYGRPDYVNEAIAMFLAQDYPRKELVILNDCPGQRFACDQPGIHVFNADERYPTLGEKRNAAIELAQGDIMAVWDDDDIYLPWRLSFSLAEMKRLATEFYRPAEFWAYWGSGPLHNNQAIREWVSHALVMFTKSLWRRVGGYPAQHLNEDDAFFQRVHEALQQSFISYPLLSEDRFFVLRGKSKYEHMCMSGGDSPLDLAPGNFELEPSPIADATLRQHVDQLIQTRQKEDNSLIGNDSLLISVCVALKNRSRLRVDDQTIELFPNSVRSLAQAAEDLVDLGSIELVVADFESDDWPLQEWLCKAAGNLRVNVVTMADPFSRGKGINAAVENATSDRIVLCDADMIVSSEAVRRAVDLVNSGKAWCPIYESLDRHGRHDCWQDLSHGMVALHRDWFAAAGRVPEFQSWGGEDDLFHNSLAEHVGIVRERSPFLRHQWHPESCRHEHYKNPRQSDFWKHMTEFRSDSSMKNEPMLRFYAVHPDWEGELHCFPSGRMMRPGIDSGSYELTSKQIILKWDKWPVETLDWDDEAEVYIDSVKNFRLRQFP